MTRDELMRLAAEKAVAELSWDSIEFLLRPKTALELLLRLDFEGMKRKIEVSVPAGSTKSERSISGIASKVAR